MSSMRGARPAFRATSSAAGSLHAPVKRNGYGAGAIRPAVLGLAKLMMLPLASAMPLLQARGHSSKGEEELPKDPSDPDLYVYLGIAVALVLLGGVMAGLTIALMGQDETYLQVIATSGEGAERRHAKRVLGLLSKGKHWVLVTLLLSNVITNETLPIVLDRSLGGGWPAVVSSTVLIGKLQRCATGDMVWVMLTILQSSSVKSLLSLSVSATVFLSEPSCRLLCLCSCGSWHLSHGRLLNCSTGCSVKIMEQCTTSLA